MKVFPPYLLLGMTVMAFFACNPNPEKILIENTGLWNVDRFYYAIYTNDTLSYDNNSINAGTMEFREDGTGTAIWGPTTPQAFEWAYDEDVEEMHLTGVSGMGLIYRIIESTKNKQLWSGEHEQTSLGRTVRREHTLELSVIE